MEEELDLLELLQILLKRKWFIVLSVVVVASIAFGYTKYGITPQYKSEMTLMVNSSKGSSISDIASSFDLGSINFSQKLVVTYSEIVKSRIVLEQVIDKMDLDMSYKQLLDSISASPVGSTEILKITVKSTDPILSSDIANNISSVFIKEVMRILKVNNVEIIDEAIPLTTPINVKILLNTAIGAVLGFMLAVGVVFLMAFLDRTVKTVEDVEKHLGLPVIGSIIDFEADSKEEARHGRANRTKQA